MNRLQNVYPIEEISREAARDFYRAHGERIDPTSTPCRAYAIRRNGAIAATALVITDRFNPAVEARANTLSSVLVQPEARGLGLGRSLTAAALQDYPDVVLSVVEDNTAARALYEGLGFRAVRQVDDRIVMSHAELAYVDPENMDPEDAQPEVAKNVPTDDDLWGRAKQAAKNKFSVYPSWVANQWASRWYSHQGGKWHKEESMGFDFRQRELDRRANSDQVDSLYYLQPDGRYRLGPYVDNLPGITREQLEALNGEVESVLVVEQADTDEDELYYLQPDGRWEMGPSDNRSPGRTREELEAMQAEFAAVMERAAYITEDELREASQAHLDSVGWTRSAADYMREVVYPQQEQRAEQAATAEVPSVPAMVKRAAHRGLELREQHGQGGTAVGVARARDLRMGRVSWDTIRRMRAYFDRHEVDKSGADWNNQSKPSAGRIAWLLWGGDAGRSWANRLLKQRETAAVSDTDDQPTYGYISAKPDAESVSRLVAACQEVGLTHMDPDKFHVTLMYDKNNPAHHQGNTSAHFEATVTGYEMMGEPGTKWYALALTLDSPDLAQYNAELLEQGFTSSYPTYKPHLSLAYAPSPQQEGIVASEIMAFTHIGTLHFHEQPWTQIEPD